MGLVGLKRETGIEEHNKYKNWHWTFEGLDEPVKKSLETPMATGKDKSANEGSHNRRKKGDKGNVGLWDREMGQPNGGKEFLGAIPFHRELNEHAGGITWIRYLYDIPGEVNPKNETVRGLDESRSWYGHVICQYGQLSSSFHAVQSVQKSHVLD